MMRLNGWKRIGIIASVVWILGAGTHTYNSEINSAIKGIDSLEVACESPLPGETADTLDDRVNKCDKHSDDFLALAISNARFEAALVAFVPVPLGWGFTYLVLFLVRWIKRGFMRPL